MVLRSRWVRVARQRRTLYAPLENTKRTAPLIYNLWTVKLEYSQSTLVLDIETKNVSVR